MPYDQDYSQAQNRQNLLQSMMAQNMQPINRANPATSLGKILTSYFLKQGRNSAERDMGQAVEGRANQRMTDLSSALSAYREDTPHDYDMFPGESPIEGLKDIGTGQNREALIQSMMGAQSPGIQEMGLNAMMATPADKRPSKLKLYDAAIRQGYTGNLTDFLKMTGSKGININNIPRAKEGFRNVYNDAGQVTHQEIIEGGPVDLKQREKAEKKEASEIAAEGQQFSSNMQRQEFIGQIDKAIKNNTFFTTGMVGKIASFWPSSDARFQEKLLERIQGEIALDRLSKAQQASKTGGVFGSLQKAELDLLKNSIEALEVGMSEEKMLEGLEGIREHRIKFDAAMELRNDPEYTDLASFGKWDNTVKDGLGNIGGIELLNGVGEIIGYYR